MNDNARRQDQVWGWTQGGSKVGQGWVQGRSKDGSRGGSRVGPGQVLGGVQGESSMGPGWVQGGSRVGSGWVQGGSRVGFRVSPGCDPRWVQGGFRVCPMWGQGGARAQPRWVQECIHGAAWAEAWCRDACRIGSGSASSVDTGTDPEQTQCGARMYIQVQGSRVHTGGGGSEQ